jgi:thiol-disulfide isomerase/thioredoxin
MEGLWTRRILFIVLAVTAVGLAGTAAWNRPAKKPAVVKAAPRDDSAEEPIRFAKNPEAAPAFLARDLNGNIVSTANWGGKVTLLTFWATWCAPCRAEIPLLISLEKQYEGKLQVIGISVDEASPDEVKEFARRVGINYPVVMGTRDLVARYGGVPALPTSFLINRDARIVQKHVGLFPPEVYDREIRALLGLPVGAPIETFEDHGQIFLKNAANATELPGLDLSKLTAEQRRVALKKMNAEACGCGCGLTIAQCRVNDSNCAVSLGLAKKILEEVSRQVPTAHSTKNEK